MLKSGKVVFGFAELVLAMQSTFVYGDAALCFLPKATCAEIVGGSS